MNSMSKDFCCRVMIKIDTRENRCVCLPKNKYILYERGNREMLMEELVIGENEEGERKMEMCGSENGERSKNVGGGYSRDWPPEDDCCPICFDDFQFPSRTSCGHWFCSSCILELWRYRANLKQCKCPICGCLILNLVLHSIQPGEEVGKILRDIQSYNTMNLGGFSALLMKAAALPVVIRRGVWENVNLRMLEYICNSMHRIGLLLGVVYEVFELRFFPNGGLGIAVWFDLCIYALVVFLLWDVLCHRWMLLFRRLL